MTFTEWYQEEYSEKWNDELLSDYGFAIEISDKYEAWCKENNVPEVWNG